MKFKSFYLALIAFCISAIPSTWANSTDQIIYLDLSKASTPLQFNENTGMWADTFDDDITEIESQVFSIVHESISDWQTWYGFTVSNSIDNKFQTNFLTYQYSNMAKGGILLNEDGSIKTNENGAPVTGKEMPYLVSFAGFSNPSITFNTGKSYQVIGAYFNLNSYTFYSLLYGDGVAHAFSDGDEFVLTVHGIDSQENETSVKVTLGSFQNGCLTASTGWQYVDLQSLGVVEEIYFTMNSTDIGDWGMNTPAYFCMDKLAVKEVSSSAISSQSLKYCNLIRYNRELKTIELGAENFVTVYNSSGQMVMSSEGNSISVSHLPAGIYLVKSGKSRLKFAR